MLIAIMADTYAEVSAQAESNARITKLEIMEDYIHLIVHDIENSNLEIIGEDPNYKDAGDKDKNGTNASQETEA